MLTDVSVSAMSAWTSVFVALPGLLAGMLIWSRIAHLLHALVGIDGEQETAKSDEPASSRRQLLIVIAFVAGWLALFGGLAFYLFNAKGAPAEWFWFFVGIATTPGIILPPVLITWFRYRRRALDDTAAPQTSETADAKFVYNIKFDEPYIRTMSNRYLRVLPMGNTFKVSLGLVAGVAITFWLLKPIGDGSSLIAFIFFAVSIPTVFAARHVSKQIMYSDFGYASHMGKSSIYTLSAKGLEVVGPRPCHEAIWPDVIEWPRILRAARFRDGILLCGFGGLSESLVPAWLPDSALQHAQPGDVLRIIEERMQPRTVKKLN